MRALAPVNSLGPLARSIPVEVVTKSILIGIRTDIQRNEAKRISDPVRFQCRGSLLFKGFDEALRLADDGKEGNFFEPISGAPACEVVMTGSAVPEAFSGAVTAAREVVADHVGRYRERIEREKREAERKEREAERKEREKQERKQRQEEEKRRREEANRRKQEAHLQRQQWIKQQKQQKHQMRNGSWGHGYNYYPSPAAGAGGMSMMTGEQPYPPAPYSHYDHSYGQHHPSHGYGYHDPSYRGPHPHPHYGHHPLHDHHGASTQSDGIAASSSSSSSSSNSSSLSSSSLPAGHGYPGPEYRDPEHAAPARSSSADIEEEVGTGAAALDAQVPSTTEPAPPSASSSSPSLCEEPIPASDGEEASSDRTSQEAAPVDRTTAVDHDNEQEQEQDKPVPQPPLGMDLEEKEGSGDANDAPASASSSSLSETSEQLPTAPSLAGHKRKRSESAVDVDIGAEAAPGEAEAPSFDAPAPAESQQVEQQHPPEERPPKRRKKDKKEKEEKREKTEKKDKKSTKEEADDLPEEDAGEKPVPPDPSIHLPPPPAPPASSLTSSSAATAPHRPAAFSIVRLGTSDKALAVAKIFCTLLSRLPFSAVPSSSSSSGAAPLSTSLLTAVDPRAVMELLLSCAEPKAESDFEEDDHAAGPTSKRAEKRLRHLQKMEKARRDKKAAKSTPAAPDDAQAAHYVEQALEALKQYQFMMLLNAPTTQDALDRLRVTQSSSSNISGHQDAVIVDPMSLLEATDSLQPLLRGGSSSAAASSSSSSSSFSSLSDASPASTSTSLGSEACRRLGSILQATGISAAVLERLRLLANDDKPGKATSLPVSSLEELAQVVTENGTRPCKWLVSMPAINPFKAHDALRLAPVIGAKASVAWIQLPLSREQKRKVECLAAKLAWEHQLRAMNPAAAPAPANSGSTATSPPKSEPVSASAASTPPQSEDNIPSSVPSSSPSPENAPPAGVDGDDHNTASGSSKTGKHEPSPPVQESGKLRSSSATSTAAAGQPTQANPSTAPASSSSSSSSASAPQPAPAGPAPAGARPSRPAYRSVFEGTVYRNSTPELISEQERLIEEAKRKMRSELKKERKSQASRATAAAPSASAAGGSSGSSASAASGSTACSAVLPTKRQLLSADPYVVLGLDPYTSDTKSITRRYRDLARLLHPDRQRTLSSADPALVAAAASLIASFDSQTEAFILVQKACATLTNK